MTCASFVRAPRFPAVAFDSHEDFLSFCAQKRDQLQGRAEYHQTLATSDSALTSKGTCAPCLRPVEFVSSMDDAVLVKDGRRIPDWGRQMRCSCDERLMGDERALIHFLQATALAPWAQSLLLGPCSVAHRIAKLSGSAIHVPTLRPSGTPAIDSPGARFHVVISQNYLHRVSGLEETLTDVLRVLVAGGRFVFTIPFQADAASSDLATLDVDREARSRSRAAEHRLGWNLLPTLRKIGFRQARAHLYWSEELGYLGNRNFIFNAVK